jgi:hypothetical protein
MLPPHAAARIGANKMVLVIRNFMGCPLKLSD